MRDAIESAYQMGIEGRRRGLVRWCPFVDPDVNRAWLDGWDAMDQTIAALGRGDEHRVIGR